MSDAVRMRVMTFNIHGGRPRIGAVDLEATARVIREAHPDIAGLQEVHRYMPPPYVFQDQPARLRRLLEMEVTFRPSFGLGPCGYGNAFLSREPPQRVDCVRLPREHFEPRSLLDARFSLSGRRFRVLNAHLGVHQGERRRQLKAIAERVRGEELPVIVLGDWNATPNDPEIGIVEQAGLKIAAKGETHTFPCDNPQCRLDYIATSCHFELEECRTIPTRVSDHLPLVVDLLLR